MRRALALLLLLLAAAASAQEAATVSLDLGMDAAVPGEDVSLLVVLSTTGAPKVGSLRFDVLVPTSLVSFVDLSKRASAETAGAQINAELVKPKEGSDDAIVRVEITSPNAIPDGILVALNFDVSKQAQVGSPIRLKAGAITAGSVEGDQVSARALDGEIQILSDIPQVTACFFYMH